MSQFVEQAVLCVAAAATLLLVWYVWVHLPSRRRSRLHALAQVLSNVVHLRQHEYGARTQSVSEWCIKVATELRMAPQETEEMLMAVAIRDIGLVELPYRVLHDEALWKSDPTVRAQVENHPEVGAAWLESLTDLAHLSEIVRYHRTAFVRHTTAPLASRIIHVVTHYLEYMESREPSSAWKEMLEATGQFDLEVMAAFERVLTFEGVRVHQPSRQVA